MTNGEKHYQEFLLVDRVDSALLPIRTIHHIRSIAEVLDRFIEVMVDSIGSTLGVVMLMAPDERYLRITTARSRHRPGSLLLDWDPRVGTVIPEEEIMPEFREVIKTGKYSVLRRDGTRALEALAKYVNFRGILQSALIVPLTRNEVVVGLAILGEMRSWERSPLNETKLNIALKTAQLISDFLKSPDQLTVPYIKSVLIPYIEAIEEIQSVIDKYQNREHNILRVKLISQNSPISLSLDGASAVIDVVKEMIVPWRKEHAQIMARLAVQEKIIGIEEKKVKVRKEKLEAEKLVLESIKEQTQVERMKLENENLALDLYQKKVDLALHIISRLLPNLSMNERNACVARLLDPLEVLMLSELEILPKSINGLNETG